MSYFDINRSGELAIFIRVVELGSFSAVARACNMTPSAVSKLISRLEKDWVSGYSIVQHVSFSLPVKDASFMSKAFKYSMTWTNWNNRLPQIIYRKGELESIPVFHIGHTFLPCISLFNQRYRKLN